MQTFHQPSFDLPNFYELGLRKGAFFLSARFPISKRNLIPSLKGLEKQSLAARLWALRGGGGGGERCSDQRVQCTECPWSGWLRLLTVGVLAEGSTGSPAPRECVGAGGGQGDGRAWDAWDPRTFSVPEALMKGAESFSFAGEQPGKGGPCFEKRGSTLGAVLPSCCF